MKRYTPDLNCLTSEFKRVAPCADAAMMEHTTGNWVTHDDHLLAMENLKSQAKTLEDALEQMTRAHKAMIQAGYDRIKDLGGSCDSPEVMISGNPDIASATKILCDYRGSSSDPI